MASRVGFGDGDMKTGLACWGKHGLRGGRGWNGLFDFGGCAVGSLACGFVGECRRGCSGNSAFGAEQLVALGKQVVVVWMGRVWAEDDGVGLLVLSCLGSSSFEMGCCVGGTNFEFGWCLFCG